MYLIIGLGNPEEEYAKTRHNMGFDVINQIAEQNKIEISKKKFDALYGTGVIEKEKVILLKPQTYMNLSGQAVRKWMDFYKLQKEDIILIYDDMDIEPGKIKVRKQGGPGGHNGMKSVIQQIGTEEFTRIRIGIGRPNHETDKINYVIGKTSEEEQKILKQGVNQAVKAVESIIQNGVDQAMNQYN